MPSLSDLEAKPLDSRPEREVYVILDIPLVKRVNALAEEVASLYAAKSAKDRARYMEAKTELESLAPDVEAKGGMLLVRANLTLGEWNRFTDENPPRPKEDPAHKRDVELTGGRVNADALLDALDRFTAEWDGEPLAPAVRDAKGVVVKESQFDRLLRDNIPPGTLREALAAVVLMYMEAPDFSGWRSALQSDLRTFRDFAEPVTSESLRSDSTAGNPEPSSEVSTETEIPAP